MSDTTSMKVNYGFDTSIRNAFSIDSASVVTIDSDSYFPVFEIKNVGYYEIKIKADDDSAAAKFEILNGEVVIVKSNCNGKYYYYQYSLGDNVFVRYYIHIDDTTNFKIDIEYAEDIINCINDARDFSGGTAVTFSAGITVPNALTVGTLRSSKTEVDRLVVNEEFTIKRKGNF